MKVTGKKGVEINGGGSAIRLTPEGIEMLTNGKWELFSAMKNFTGPKAMPIPSKPSICEDCMAKAEQQASPTTPRT